MAVIKLTSSGKALMFIDDDGNIFITSITAVNKTVNSTNPNNFIVLTRMPNQAAPDRFPKSPLYNAPVTTDASEKITTNNDAFGKKPKIEKEVRDVLL
jgi:hypothetical protein